MKETDSEVYLVTHQLDSKLTLLGVTKKLQSAQTLAESRANQPLTWKQFSDVWYSEAEFGSYEINQQPLID